MKKLGKIKAFALGFIFAAVICSLCVPALAAMTTKTISVQNGISVFLDDNPLDMKDANGNPVEAFAYNGTTYLPARAVSTAVGKSIVWDGTTSSVYIGTHKTGTSTSASDLIGTWKTTYQGYPTTFTFNSDGTYSIVVTISSLNRTSHGTYTTSGNTMTLQPENDSSATGTFKFSTVDGKQVLLMTMFGADLTCYKN